MYIAVAADGYKLLNLVSEEFDIIADEEITRYDGHGYSVKDALILMDQNRLKLIRNVHGTDECDTSGLLS
jgi:hypothetical protein